MGYTEKYVIKKYGKDDERFSDKFNNIRVKGQAMFEVRRLRDCVHANVVKFFGVTKTETGDWLLLIEYCENGDIETYYD